jgi:hypothetical protein
VIFCKISSFLDKRKKNLKNRLKKENYRYLIFYYFYQNSKLMQYRILYLLLIMISMVSCRKDFDTVPSTGKLEFSKTTVYLDTVFTNVASSTYQLKVYNRSKNDITIPNVSFAKGISSKYRMMIDGKTGIGGTGKSFSNIEILANDSLFVFVEATASIANANPTDLLYTDEILFDNESLQQKVNLVTLIQDAVFLYPEKYPNGTYESLQIGADPANRIYGFFLDDSELTFTKTKPYVIYGYAAVPSGKTLTIQAGARVHFHDQAGIIVANLGSIHVEGTVSTTPKLENEVVFEGDRLEPYFAEIPGQWGTILLTNGSTNNSFNHLTIKNSSVGIFIQNHDATTVEIKNTQIYNSSNVGILARTANINGENIVINKAGQYALACTLGGAYNFKHCTFVNYWSGGSRQSPSVLLDNTFYDGKTIFKEDLTQANFNNCIVFGNNNIEISLKKDVAKLFNYTIKNSLVKFNDISNLYGTNPLYNFVFSPTTNNNIIGNSSNTNDPLFKDASKNNLRIKLNSPAKASGNPTFNVLQDAEGKTRTLPPDLGAYQHLDL